MPIDLRQKAQLIDDYIRHGKVNLARAELRLLKKIKVPRAEAPAIASLAYRAGMPTFGIRVLNPIVRPNRRAPVEASDEEKAVYAQCLNRIGACEEALGILDAIDAAKLPQVYFFKATSLISRWDYEATIPLWMKYVRSSGLGAYQKLVGKLNLAAALVFTRDHRRSTPLLRELLYETSLQRLDLLYGNALELSAQDYLAQEKWENAEKCLAMAESKLNQSDTVDALFVRKWKALIKVMQTGGAEASLRELEAVRTASADSKHWETLRQCDEIQAMATRDQNLLWKVYFGTPFPTYRSRLLEEFGESLSPPEKYTWSPGGGKKSSIVLDVKSGAATKDGIALREGHVMHRLLAVLASDFYRPLRTAAIHFRINPEEFYNPISSPPRVHEAVKRLRLWCEEHKLPLEVEEQAGFYRLTSRGGCGLIVRNEAVSVGKHSSPIDKLKLEFPEAPFSLREAAEKLGIPDRTLHRILDQAIKEGRLKKMGQSRATRYSFSPGRAEEAA